MKRNKIEFKVGDKVTFFPYEKRLKAIIREVDTHTKELHNEPEERIFYLLHGCGGDSVLSRTTGMSIEESQYFVPYTEEEKANFFR